MEKLGLTGTDWRHLSASLRREGRLDTFRVGASFYFKVLETK